MKIRKITLLVLSSVFLTGTLWATPSQPLPEKKADERKVVVSDEDVPPPPQPRKISKEDAQMLKALFMMSDAELKHLRMFIQDLEKVPEAKRQALAKHFDRACMEMTPEQRKAYEHQMRERFRKSQENLLAKYYATLSPEEADAERKKFLELDHKARREYISEIRKKLGYMPYPSSKNGRKHQGRKWRGPHGSKRGDMSADNAPPPSPIAPEVKEDVEGDEE